MKLLEIAQRLGAQIVWPNGREQSELEIKKPAPIDNASEGDISFIANPDYAKFAKTTKASALIVREAFENVNVVQLLHPQPYFAFAKTAQWFFKPPSIEVGIAPGASIDATAKIGRNVAIANNATVAANAVIGDRVVIYPGVYIGQGVTIGDDTILYPNVVVYYGCKIGKSCIVHAGSVIGSDGFGYAVGNKEIAKIPQVGIVLIEDEVEIGALCTVDRAAMGVTKIGRGTKLDSRVQIGHNVVVGEHCMFSAFTGIAGSAKIGDQVIIGGHSGVNGHIEVCSGTRVGAMSGVVKSTTEPGEYVGFPAIPAMQWRRQQVHLRKLADYEKRLRDLEAKLADGDRTN